MATDENGQLYRRRSMRTEVLSHAVSIQMRSAYCPYSACGQDGKKEYYTPVDMMIIDGPMRHPWTTTDPFPETFELDGDYTDYYKGEYYGSMYRYFRKRKAVSTTVGFHVNGSTSCEPGLSPRVSIGIFCSWDDKRADLRNKCARRHPARATRAPPSCARLPRPRARRRRPIASSPSAAAQAVPVLAHRQPRPRESLRRLRLAAAHGTRGRAWLR